MPKTKSIQKQKRYLKIGFVFVFALSFGAVLFERSRVDQEALLLQEKRPLPLTEYVKGESVERGSGIEDYQAIVSINLLQLNQAIDALIAGKDVSSYSVNEIYQNFFDAPIPSPYRSMHLALIVLSKETTKKSEADTEFLSLEREKLYLAYPWLAHTKNQ
ncbi:hypothetical protein BK004_01165 [bacterium CG10_46_32]|nr:MAG: hypothetical protein BK004_01165 [bacterium CG10_46_32]PIR56308.1 MAG: hypothetical protein COU73_01180 [Parcubacteria group bacterium CG10_big_fil_rev_8_21_14_0_10_46_32]